MKMILMLIIMTFSMHVIAGDENQGISDLTAHEMFDNRTSLNLPPRMNHRLLANMRGQLTAIQSIIGHLASDRFERASRVARTKLGMTKGLKKIYAYSDNDEFNKHGKAANNSANELADILKTKDLKKSLQALRKTMGNCVQCHKLFSQ